MVKKTFRIEDFNAIRCEFVADIYYTQGKSYSVEAQASEKIMNMVSIHKKGNTLVIAKKKGNKICKYPVWQISMPKKWMWKTLA